VGRLRVAIPTTSLVWLSMEISLMRDARGAICLQHEVFGESPALEG
jgi:hypothetical protein